MVDSRISSMPFTKSTHAAPSMGQQTTAHQGPSGLMMPQSQPTNHTIMSGGG